MLGQTINSILAVDCGSATTTAALIEQAGGRYRLVATGQAASTYEPPWRDITVGIQEASRSIEQATGRILLKSDGWPLTPHQANQQGIDAFVVVSSAGPPLQIILAGLMQQVTLASARRAAATIYTRVVSELSLDAERSPLANPPLSSPKAVESPAQSGRAGPDMPIQALQMGQAEVILLVGGADGGAERPVVDMARLIAMALRVLKGGDKPSILYAGNIETRSQVAEILGPVAELKAVDNVRPTLETENLTGVQVELERFYIQRKMFQVPGLQKLSGWSQYPLLPASKSFEKVVTYIGQHNNLNVIGVHIGSRATVVSTQSQMGQSSTVRGDAGVGHSLAWLLKIVPLEQFQRWLPFEITPEALYNQLLNKSLYPTSIPVTYEELLIEQAIAREALRFVVEQARTGWSLQQATGRRDIQWNLVMGGGRPLTHTPHPGYAAMVMLDGLEPWGVTSLALDANGVTNILGSIALVQPLAAVEVTHHDAFLNLGTVVAPAGHGQPGRPALKLKLSRTDGSSTETEVSYGSIQAIPLPPGEKGTLEIRPARRFDIGLGQPGRGALAEIEGGVLGIIIDARGRPLRLPKDEQQRQEQLRQWLQELGVKHANSGSDH